MGRKIQLRIGGMTCANCQRRIENRLNFTKGVLHAAVSYRTGLAHVTYDEDKISREGIVRAIEALDYQVLPSGVAGFDLVRSAGLLVLVAGLYAALQFSGVLGLLAPGDLAQAGMGYGVLFLLGLTTSVHCVAMCGGIGLSQSLRGGAGRRFLPALSYNLGRVCSYTAAGFVLGLGGWVLGGGGSVGLSPLLQGLVKMAAGLLMVLMGLGLLGIFPRLRGFSLPLPRFLPGQGGGGQREARRPFAVGLLNGLMPCGPLQSMWLAALAAGDPLAGALSMLCFSLGTVPLMLGLGTAAGALGRRFARPVLTAGAVLVVVMGLSMLSQGGTLSGWLSPELLLCLLLALGTGGLLLSLPVGSPWLRRAACAVSLVVLLGGYGLWSARGPASGTGEVPPAAGSVQEVRSRLAPGRYPDITVRAGIPARWVIDAPRGSITGCNSRMLIHAYGIEYTFTNGENVIEFTPEKAGTVRYSCWMGMIHGTISVTET